MRNQSHRNAVCLLSTDIMKVSLNAMKKNAKATVYLVAFLDRHMVQVDGGTYFKMLRPLNLTASEEEV